MNWLKEAAVSTEEVKKLTEITTDLFNALKVISLDSKISAWLKENDPKALEQVNQVLIKAEGAF